jgi:dienelactone hydrolase
MRHIWIVVLVSAVSMIAHVARADHTSLPADITPIRAAWLWGHYAIPGSITKDGSPYWYAYPHVDASRIADPPWTEVASTHIKAGAKTSAVLFLHGCSGMIRGGVGYRTLLLSEGYALFEPDSFARPGYSCKSSSLKTRRTDAEYALAQIRKLPWVDQSHVFLIGFSQGGRIVASWEESGFAAHVILAADCGGKSPKAPAETPVLAMLGSDDNYYTTSCRITREIGNSRSVVIEGADHELLSHPEAKQTVSSFLRECCS